MSTLHIPISGKVLWATGDLKLWIDLELSIQDRSGGWQPATFRIDSGSEITMFPAYDAKRMGLPFPQHPSQGIIHPQTGLEIRSGVIRFRVAGLDHTEYAISCLFLGDPDNPSAGNPGAFPHKLLQPLALLDWFRVTFNKNATISAPYGEMILEKK